MDIFFSLRVRFRISLQEKRLFGASHHQEPPTLLLQPPFERRIHTDQFVPLEGNAENASRNWKGEQNVRSFWKVASSNHVGERGGLCLYVWDIFDVYGFRVRMESRAGQGTNSPPQKRGFLFPENSPFTRLKTPAREACFLGK